MTAIMTPACKIILISRSAMAENRALTSQARKKKPRSESSGASFKKSCSGADDRAGRVVAGLRRLRVRGGGGPALGRASDDHGRNGDVLRRREAVQRRQTGR